MLLIPLLLCSLVRALPSRCQAHEDGYRASHSSNVEASGRPQGHRWAPVGETLYTPGPEPVYEEGEEEQKEDETDSGVQYEQPRPDSAPAPNPDSASRLASSDVDPDPASKMDPLSIPAPFPPATNGGDCKCGYILSSHSNTYFPSAHIVSFASLPSGPLQISDLANLGFEVNNQWQVGGEYQGTRSVGSINALSGVDGALAMTVKGGQKVGGDIEAAEIIFKPEGGMVGGVFGMEAMMSSTPGTCQSIFTYNLLQGAPGDEQDIEVLGHTIFGTMANGTPPGVQLTNHDPAGSTKNSHLTVPFVADPTTAYNNYTIAWLPGQTSYYMNDQPLKSPQGYFSVNPNHLFINHWSNGDPGFTQGPPTENVVMKIKSVTFYYAQKGKEGMPAGCSKEAACVV